MTYKPTTPGLFVKSISSNNSLELYKAWHHVVNNFVLRNITCPSDRLPAISGMAKKIEAASGSKYIAGIWRDNLPSDLLWSSAPFLQNPHFATRTDAYRAPSFSWASVETQVHYERLDDEIESSALIKVVRAESKPSGLNPLGEVSDGFVLLQAQRVVEGTLIAPAEYEFHYRLKIFDHSADVSPDSLLIEGEIVSDTDGKQRTVRRAKTGEIYEPFKAPVTCLAISASSDGCISGLVLGLTSRVQGAYERLGMFTCGSAVFEGGLKKRVKIV
jgi:hypothetical protein